MTKDEKEAMRDGFDLCLKKIDQQKQVIEKLISWLHLELGVAAATELLKDLNAKQ